MSKRRKTIGDKYKIVCAIAIFVALIFPFILCIILKFCVKYISGDTFVITKEIDNWFSFYGSYCGIFVSIILGVITLRLTVRIDSNNQEDIIRQSKMSIALNMPNFKCIEMFLYSLDRGDILSEYLDLFDQNSSYLLSVKMSPAFPPYFDVHIMKVKICLKNIKNGNDVVIHAPLCADDYRIRNNNDLLIIINLPENLNDILHNFYLLNQITTSSTAYERLLGQLYIEFQCFNVLLPEDDGDVRFDLHFSIKNIGRKKESNGLAIEVINREFLRIK